MTYNILLLPGDGIGPEVTAEARRVLLEVATSTGFELNFSECLIGGAAIAAHGDPLPPVTLEACGAADAVLLGAVGSPEWSDPEAAIRPEDGLLRLRRELDLFANLRPVRLFPSLLFAQYIDLGLGCDLGVVVNSRGHDRG